MADQDNLSSLLDEVSNEMSPPSPTSFTHNSPTVNAPKRTMAQPIPPALQAGNVGPGNVGWSGASDNMDPYPEGSVKGALSRLLKPKDYLTNDEKNNFGNEVNQKAKRLTGSAAGMLVGGLTGGMGPITQAAGGIVGNELGSMGTGTFGKLLQGQQPTKGDIASTAISGLAGPITSGVTSKLNKNQLTERVRGLITARKDSINDIDNKIYEAKSLVSKHEALRDSGSPRWNLVKNNSYPKAQEEVALLQNQKQRLIDGLTKAQTSLSTINSPKTPDSGIGPITGTTLKAVMTALKYLKQF